jgi:2'-5' RNA ligase
MCCRTETARLFFALWPGIDVRSEIASVQCGLNLPARPVAVQNLHITLAFLGEVSVSSMGALLTIGSELPIPPCSLRLDRCGWFPRAGVVWLGCESPPGDLIEFHGLLAGRLAEDGFRVETRPWLPHVTLYRKMRKPYATMESKTVDWSISEYCLVKSTLSENGAVYDTVGRWQSAS